jgi:hypothetical protein
MLPVEATPFFLGKFYLNGMTQPDHEQFFGAVNSFRLNSGVSRWYPISDFVISSFPFALLNINVNRT